MNWNQLKKYVDNRIETLEMLLEEPEIIRKTQKSIGIDVMKTEQAIGELTGELTALKLIKGHMERG